MLRRRWRSRSASQDMNKLSRINTSQILSDPISHSNKCTSDVRTEKSPEATGPAITCWQIQETTVVFFLQVNSTPGSEVNNGESDNLPPEQSTYFAIEKALGNVHWFICIHLSRIRISLFLVEGSLEVKLPTIWTVEKQRWEESEEKRSEERRCRCAKR